MDHSDLPMPRFGWVLKKFVNPLQLHYLYFRAKNPTCPSTAAAEATTAEHLAELLHIKPQLKLSNSWLPGAWKAPHAVFSRSGTRWNLTDLTGDSTRWEGKISTVYSKMTWNSIRQFVFLLGSFQFAKCYFRRDFKWVLHRIHLAAETTTVTYWIQDAHGIKGALGKFESIV